MRYSFKNIIILYKIRWYHGNLSSLSTTLFSFEVIFMRKFERISEKQFRKDFATFATKYDEIKLPVRKTAYSAGYDIHIPFDSCINPNETLIIPTGIKVVMNNDEFLGIYMRSGLGTKYNLRMCNQVGIIDADYYNNKKK